MELTPPLLLLCSILFLQYSSANFVTTRVCNFEDGTYCNWMPHIREGEGTYGIITATAAGSVTNQRPQTDYNPGSINGSYFYYVKPNNYFNQVLLLSYPSQKYLTNLTFAFCMTGPQELRIFQAHVMQFEINANQNGNGTLTWERASVQFTSSSPNSSIIIESPSVPGGGGEAPIEGDPFLAIDDIVLTFTLPCDYSSLSSPGNLALSHPPFLDIVLGQVNTVSFTASSTICSQGPFIYTLESNNVSSLGAIFQFNSTTGLLTVNATGPHMIGEGVALGVITVSVYVEGSDYLQSDGAVFKRYGTLHYRQPPTITITSPSSIPVSIDVVFTYNIIALSALNVNLHYSVVQSEPSSLAANITLTNTTVHGLLSHQHVVDTIKQSIQYPSFTISVIDSYSEVRNYTIQLILPSQIPLVFNQWEYTFNVLENTNPVSNPSVGDILVGSIPYLNCDSDDITATINTTGSTISSRFRLVPLPHPILPHFCTFRLLMTTSLDYEERQDYIFDVTARDSTRGLSSVTTVTIIVDGVNEYSPMIAPKVQSISVSDYDPVNSLVLVITGTDSDTGIDGMLMYNITGGNSEYFKIEQTSNGRANLLIKHSPIVPGNYLVEVTVTDGGSPSKTDVAMVTISVIASGQIHCNESLYGPPVITESTTPLRAPIYSNVTFQCNFTANPGTYPITWYKAPLNNVFAYQPVTIDSHYSVSTNTLLITRVSNTDNAYYICNITNQCGSTTKSMTLIIIKYPAPPTDFTIIESPAQRSVSFTWTPPDKTFQSPVNGYLIQLSEEGGDYVTYSQLTYFSLSNNKIRQITLDQLHPGVNYTARILSVNDYFQSSSNTISFTTLTSAPKLAYLNVSVHHDNGLTIEWELEYSGGSHDLHMIITVQSKEVTERRRRKRSSYEPISLSYTVGVDDKLLVTPTLPFGQHYNVLGVVSSEYGTSHYPKTAFVGVHDIVHCSYSMDSSCRWTLVEGQLTQSSSVSLPKPSTDATDNSTGVYILATTSVAVEESVVLMSYPILTYICGISFYYQVNYNLRLRLETQHDNVSLIWSSPIGNHTVWTLVDIPIGDFPLSLSTDSLLITMETTGPPSPILSYAAVDEMTLHFCLPCNYSNLAQDSIKLSYSNYSTLYIRHQNQTLSIKTTVNDCPNPILHYSIQTVVPNQLRSMISIPNQRRGDINVNDVTTDIVQAGTSGYVVVKVELLAADYRNTGVTIESSAVIQFIVSERFENCSYTKSCDFEDGTSCDWQLSDQSDSSIKQMSNNLMLFSRPHSTQTKGGVVNIGHQIINDSYCGLSFLLLTHNTVLQITVSGIGTVWSSWTDTPTYSGNSSAHSSWRNVSLYIDVGSVPIISGRRLMFEMLLSNDANMIGDSFVAVDNITLHPCIDCQAQECSCISCIQQCSISPCHHGYYLSLEVNQCRPCPRGHYCDNWRSLPKACPPGTFNNMTGSYTINDCQMCSNGTYSVQTGSHTCITCPTGYNCSNPATVPVIIQSVDCNVLNTTRSYMSLGIAAVIGLSAGIILTCLVLATISCFCCYQKNKRVNKTRRKEHKMYADNFYVNPERHRAAKYKTATVKTTSTILSMMGKDTEDGNRAYANPAFDSDSDDDFSRVSILTSEKEPPLQRDPSVNSFQKIDWPDTEPFATNPFSSAASDTKSEISDMIELEDHDDHVWPALQRKKKQKEVEEFDI